MKFIDEYRSPELGQKLVNRIHRHSTIPVRFMEFCGGHTVAIFKHGIRQLLPETIKMLSGPGCPVCVTSSQDLDKAIALAKLPGVIITSFGDMLRVPGSNSSLQQAKAEGATVFFADEAGIRSDYHSGTTWAPRGQTPKVPSTGQRFSLNMISAISRRGKMRFMVTIRV